MSGSLNSSNPGNKQLLSVMQQFASRLSPDKRVQAQLVEQVLYIAANDVDLLLQQEPADKVLLTLMHKVFEERTGDRNATSRISST